eukprot:CAMPEP_0184655738 /NCGR_PEP_ID=MMETSP0308-20130426/14383_1 /TAXON_ID=38269 /ORGANISM="Gloeochaete witrockiana, Strain SAG 46.84" /LENGTH=592 /DNA_ID=CAMNT_0027092455 /DNA_START=195 /DNA_END=1973 /DNA_ORIENTATION=+
METYIKEKKPFFSFEYFPPKTEAGVENLYERIDRMAELQPLFADVTWGAGGKTADLTLEITSNTQNLCCIETMMHLTCTNMELSMLMNALKSAKDAGIMNILALRGDPPVGQERWTAVEGGLSYACDLVKLIRKHYGDYFGIGVAGYPEAHLEATSYEEDLKYLKEKVDAGADFIITQLFYDTDGFLKYVQDCRNLGIKVPIIPGIMPITNYGSFMRMTAFCKTKVPEDIAADLELIKDDDEKVKNYGIELGIKMCRKILDAGASPGLHFYTLNLEKSVTKIIEGLGMVDLNKAHRPLPWRPPARDKRSKESVRPIFWANRPKSYLARTATWDEYPNGRWGDSTSPAYGELSDHHLFYLYSGKHVDRKAIWGDHLESIDDVYETFVKFAEGKINRLPWCDQGLAPETSLISKNIVTLNKYGFLTINSQPAINGVPSSDKTVGWGAENGFVYQKAYIEFFTSYDNLQKLLKALPNFPQYSYQASNKAGTLYSNVPAASVNAVTWGVFPNKEVIQPTVVDAASFPFWKDEAFGLWTSQWGNIYAEDSKSRAVIKEVAEGFFLVNIVDNNFINSDIFAIFRNILPDFPSNGVAHS